MKVNMINLMTIDFETLKKIYLDAKNMKQGEVKHYEVWLGRFGTPNVLQVIKMKEGDGK